MSVRREVFALAPPFFTQGARAFGGGARFGDLLPDQIAFGSERHELTARGIGGSRIASLARNAFAFGDSDHLQLNFGQIFLEHLG
jgi:hypothetical protein